MESMLEIAKKDLIDFESWFSKNDYSRSSYYLQQAEEKTAKYLLDKLGLLGDKNNDSAKVIEAFGIPILSDIDFGHEWSRKMFQQLRTVYTGDKSKIFISLAGQSNPLEVINKALAIEYDKNANEEEVKELLRSIKLILDSLPKIKEPTENKLSEARPNMGNLLKENKAKAMPILEVLTNILNAQEDLNKLSNIVDNKEVPNFLVKEVIDKIISHHLMEGVICLIALAGLDIILRPRETSRYPAQEPKFKGIQQDIKEEINLCINIADGIKFD